MSASDKSITPWLLAGDWLLLLLFVFIGQRDQQDKTEQQCQAFHTTIFSYASMFPLPAGLCAFQDNAAGCQSVPPLRECSCGELAPAEDCSKKWEEVFFQLSNRAAKPDRWAATTLVDVRAPLAAHLSATML